MPHGYLKHAPKGSLSRREMRGGGSGKSTGSACRRRMKEIKLGADGFKKGSRGHGGKGAFERDVMDEIEWSRRSANDRSADCDVHKRSCTPLTDVVAPRPSVATKPAPMTTGSRVHFEAEPGVLVNGTIRGEIAGNFVVEVEGSITIPGVRREQLYLAPAHTYSDAPDTDSFVFVSAPLPRAEEAGAPVQQMESAKSSSSDVAMNANADDSDFFESIDTSAQSVSMTWATETGSKGSLPQPPSFQALQAEDEARKSKYEVVGAGTLSADLQLASLAEEDPNPRVILGLHEMGFDRQLCAEAALCTGNESVEKAARWLVDALDQHELARKTEAQQKPPPQEYRSDGVIHPSATDKREPAVPDSVGFVDRLTVALANGLPHASADEKDDGWEVVSSL